MKTYQELIQQRSELDKAINEARNKEISNAISQIRILVTEFNLTELDLFPSRKPKKLRGKVSPKFRDPATGQTWTGRGLPPAWISGQDRKIFTI